MTSVEHKLLAVATLLNPAEQHLKHIQRLLPKIKDIEAFIALAMKEGLAGLLYKNLLKSGLFETLSSTQKQKLHALYHQTVRLNLIRTHELKEILRQLTSTDIRVVLLKGIALVQELYQDVGLRSMGDIDLWVLPPDFKEFCEILISSGYGQDPLYPTTFRNDLITLDLRTHILGADRIKSRTLLLAKDQEHMFRNARSLSVEGYNALVLDPYDQILYLGLHAFKHNVDKLIWLVDIRGLTLDWTLSDWQALLDRAKEMRQSKTLFYIFFLLEQLLGYHPPTIAIQAQTGCMFSILEKKLLSMRIKKGALPDWAPLIFFSGQTGLKNQVIVICETLFPRPEILRQGFKQFPNLKVWQLYLMRFFQLAGRMIASLIR